MQRQLTLELFDRKQPELYEQIVLMKGGVIEHRVYEVQG
jgi:hypothetical protein